MATQIGEIPISNDISKKIRDLSVFCLQISSFYKSIYNVHIKKFPKSYTKNWITLFSNATYNQDAEDQLVDVLGDVGMTLADFEQLQNIRRMRNMLCHPRLPATCAEQIVDKNWKGHSSYTALKKMLNFMKKREAVYEQTNKVQPTCKNTLETFNLSGTSVSNSNAFTTKSENKVIRISFRDKKRKTKRGLRPKVGVYQTQSYVVPNHRECYVPRLLIE